MILRIMHQRFWTFWGTNGDGVFGVVCCTYYRLATYVKWSLFCQIDETCCHMGHFVWPSCNVDSVPRLSKDLILFNQWQRLDICHIVPLDTHTHTHVHACMQFQEARHASACMPGLKTYFILATFWILMCNYL